MSPPRHSRCISRGGDRSPSLVLHVPSSPPGLLREGDILPSGQVPAYDPECRGHSDDWDTVAARDMGKKVRATLDPPRGDADPQIIVEFLRLRRDASGAPISDLLGPPVQREEGWCSFDYLPYDRALR